MRKHAMAEGQASQRKPCGWRCIERVVGEKIAITLIDRVLAEQTAQAGEIACLHQLSSIRIVIVKFVSL